MERHFEQELDKLNRRIIKMGGLVADQIHHAMQALINCDMELARNIIEHDRDVDVMDVKIDKLCQRIFALAQPMATDLRFIMSSLKMNNDMERMGDLAVKIASKIEGLSEYSEIITELEINKVADMTDLIVKDVTNILSTRNIAFIKDIFELSNRIKELTQSISTKILQEMMEKKDIIIVATNLMIILTQVERIADYSTNIAEAIIFLVEGRVVKHEHPF